MYYAHSVKGGSEDLWQPLRAHAEGVERRARLYGASFGCGEAAAIAGRLHDLGKYAPAFQARLHGSRDRVEHSIAGAAVIRALLAGRADVPMAELVAYAIAGHHAGLPDRIGDASSLDARLARFDAGSLDPAWRGELGAEVPGLMREHPLRGGHWGRFSLAFLGRMIFSALIDADYRDTEAFYDGIEGRERPRDWPSLASLLPDLLARFDTHMAGLAAKPDAGSAVNRLRADILAHVRGRAAEAPGLFTLTVPTGGGKTLASLGFALDHARRHGLDRIIYAIPYTSITEQTAAIFDAVLGEGVVLEHHSSFDEEGVEREGREKLKLAMEDWAAPVVVTTTVQLFESLFSNRPGRCRKLHNIARSVIVLDEAQVQPKPLMAPIVRAIDELAANYGCTVLLCTATQPALDARHFPPQQGKPPSPLALPLAGRELAPDPAGLARQLKRVTLRFAGEMTDEQLVAALADAPQGLVIVNSRAHALALHRAATESGLEGVVHLSTRQYAVHRRVILAAVRAALKDGRPCRLIATSLVEAGVDLDFPVAWRAEAGLDSIAQAAGRVNREGKRDVGASLVTVFKPDKRHATPREIAGLVGDFDRMAGRHDDLLSPAALTDYFAEVFWRAGDSLDRENIIESFRIGAQGTDFAYRSVAERFRMIESGLMPVIVARDAAAKDAVRDLGIEAIPSGLIARRLQGYLVQVPPAAFHMLLAAEHVRLEQEQLRGSQFAVLRHDDLYDEDVGLLWEKAGELPPDMTFI